MSKIIQVQDDYILVGKDDGTIVEVNRRDCDFVPYVGDIVEVFTSGDKTIIMKQNAAPNSYNVPPTTINVQNSSMPNEQQPNNAYVANNNSRIILIVLVVVFVLPILAVGGIAGYSKAMSKYRTNKTVDQISHIAANTRILYSSQSNYTPMNRDVIERAKLMPAEMATSNGYKNAFGGEVVLKPSDRFYAGDKKAFILEYHDIPEENCIDLATLDWGHGSGGGLIALMATSDDGLGLSNIREDNCQDISRYGVAVTCNSVMSVTDAVSACNSDDHNTLIFKFH